VLFAASLTTIEVALLYLVPLPPLDGARIMWALAPPTAGWQKARYYLEEQNYGLGILIVLLLPIFGGNVGLIGRIVESVAQPIVDFIQRSV
jgi:Zn-dependent protease